MKAFNCILGFNKSKNLLKTKNSPKTVTLADYISKIVKAMVMKVSPDDWANAQPTDRYKLMIWSDK